MTVRREAESGAMARFRLALFRAAAVTVGAGLIVGALAVSFPAPDAKADQQPIAPIGHLDRKSDTVQIANGNVLIDYRARRGYQASSFLNTAVTEYDLDTLKPVGKMTWPVLQTIDSVSGATDWLWTLDSSKRRIFAFREGTPDEQTRLQNYALLVADLKARTMSAPITLWPLAERIPIALSYHAPSDRLYILSKAKLDAGGRSAYWIEERKPDGTLVWDRRAGSCHGARDAQYAPSLARSILQPEFIYFNCYNVTLIQGQVVRVRLGSDGLPAAEESFPAVPGALSTLFDPGSDRMFFLTTNSGAGRGAWVFDGRRSSFLGVIASGDNRPGASDYAMGVDPVTGRLYMQTPAGLLVADARRTPLPSGLLFRQYAGFGVGLIQVDPVARTVFVPDPKSLSDVGRPERYVLYRDSIPRSTDPPAGDPDGLTLNVAEKAGVTQATYTGGARGFGVRALQTGGTQKTIWNLALGQFAPDDPSSPLFNSAYATLGTVPVDASNREIVAAQVRSVSLSNDDADAIVRGVHIDEGSERDVAKANGSTWPFAPVECHDAGEKADASSSTLVAASCNVKGAFAFGSAGSSNVPLNDVSVSSAYSIGSVKTDAKRGLVATSTSLASGVSIAGRVTIGSVRADAQTAARGRPGTATATFTRIFKDVRVDANADGVTEFSCGATCDPRAVANAINVALAGLALVELPEPDALYYPAGSKGGYQSIVQKERFRSYSERALNDDETAEIPALQIVTYNDGRAGRTRHVVQLAGVQAESHYGILLLPSDVQIIDPPTVQVLPRKIEREPTVVAGPPPPVTAPKLPSTRTVIDRVARRIPLGAAVALTRPRTALLLAALWSFLALPLYLTWRRRLIGTAIVPEPSA